MKIKKPHFLTVLLLLMLASSLLGHAQEPSRTFTVQDGAFPWYDRVNTWSLYRVPESLKGPDLIPQQNCGSRSLEVPGNPKLILVGVMDYDMAAFSERFKSTEETGQHLEVENTNGTVLGYSVYKFPNPPAKIDGSGFSASLMLLKLDPPLVGSKVFVVENGAFPWYDRVNGWSLANVPASLKGAGPLPQQSCGNRSVEFSNTPKRVLVGVSEKDLSNFKSRFPAAIETGEALSIKSAKGENIPYRVLKLENPGKKIDGTGNLAGMLLLRMEGQEPPSADATSMSSSIPAAPPAIPFETGDKSTLHIYLLMGQSNMVGRDTRGIEAQVLDRNIGFLDKTNRWVVAREPMHEGGSGFGPGIFFAREMLKKHPGTKIGLVPCAVGGTPLARWVKGADLYERAVRRASEAMKSGTLMGVLWHQGESDSNTLAEAEAYEAKLEKMFVDLRGDLHSPDLPIVVGQLGEFLAQLGHCQCWQTVNTALTHLPSDLPGVGLAESKGLPDKGDHLHFSAAGAEEFGRRYAESMIKLEKPSR